jgi:hypothetical protein
MREKPLTPNPMNITPNTMSRLKSLMNLVNITEGGPGMTPNEFEAYCELAGIQTASLVTSPTDFNKGIYHVTLPEYGYRCAFSMNGQPVVITN